MLRFSRKSSEKENKKKISKKKAEKVAPNKGKSSKGKDSPKNKTTPEPWDEEEEEENPGLIGVQRCRKLLASCPKRTGSAKCAATFKRKSRLSKNLSEVLVDDSVLPYFMEYMQDQNAINLLNFWLTAETFRLSTINRLKINSLSRLKSTKHEEGLVNGGDQYDGKISPNLLLDHPVQGSDSRDRILSDSSTESEFGCFTQFNGPSGSTATNLLAQLDIGSVLFCDNCSSIIDKRSKVCSVCGKNVSPDYGNDEDNELDLFAQSRHSMKGGLFPISDQNPTSCTDGQDDTFTTDKNKILSDSKHDQRKVTFDLKPDFENEEREFCRRRTRSIVIDAVSIYSKYISLEATHPFGLDEPLRRQVEANICSEDGKIDPECFVPAQKFAFRVMERMYFPAFSQSSWYCKHQIDMLTSGSVFLSDIMYNEHAVFYFMEFLEQEGVRHMLEFWLTADNFQSMLKTKMDNGSYNASQALDDAMIIYERYFSMQASLPLGFDDVTRIHIENSICREGGPLPECFAIPMEHILCLLEEVFFPSFLQSEIYFQYLSERLNSVSDYPPLHAPVMGGAKPEAKLSVDETTHLVASSELDLSENPDAIWHRPNKGPLSLGRVNEFGIFEPIFEPDPDSGNNMSTAAKLGKAMRKLVSGGEDKAKEEMAWKIAKMMIEDVRKEQLKGKAS
ncbi:A-kinase anchor protein 10, mitochondrial [Nematostella vectensis]|uniref:A-kinase anchor protein 10, mitochondrial n=1 Tax=Nematostella vectensis TaxID=45351 RepID=UPI0013900F28|nr:A-kinase anchor protein 10, mitochondrial [Nematostella vectensis]XP_048583113.1 A-kinase anchor protein 10, mitochondrial [Nematostella vectensis]